MTADYSGRGEFAHPEYDIYPDYLMRREMAKNNPTEKAKMLRRFSKTTANPAPLVRVVV